MLYHKNQNVTVRSPARLHLGFVDLGGALGRKFISAGVTIDGFSTELTIKAAKKFEAQGECSERALDFARELFEKWNLDGGCHITVRRSIPEHSGLGSGTQLALCVGAGVANLFDYEIDAVGIAQELGRGARSGIGVAAFQQGGMIIDGGRGSKTRVPPTIVRHPFPEAWRILIIQDESDLGLHGAPEADAFSTLPRFSDSCAGFLSRQVLARILPGLIENNIQEFGLGVREIQQRVGDYFAPAQGGRYTSAAAAEVIEYLIKKDIPGVGQSSWGPTGFAFFDSDTAAHTMMRECQNQFTHLTQLSYKVVKGNNVGSVVTISENGQQNQTTQNTG
ncbi:MAG: GHMP kinase [Gammaproteobacteria bacterium]|nr:GHMP kinase [Gammaproteobacteria bacterium]